MQLVEQLDFNFSNNAARSFMPPTNEVFQWLDAHVEVPTKDYEDVLLDAFSDLNNVRQISNENTKNPENVFRLLQGRYAQVDKNLANRFAELRVKLALYNELINSAVRFEGDVGYKHLLDDYRLAKERLKSVQLSQHEQKLERVRKELKSSIEQLLSGNRNDENSLTAGDRFLLNVYTDPKFIAQPGDRFIQPVDHFNRILTANMPFDENKVRAYARAATRLELFEQYQSRHPDAFVESFDEVSSELNADYIRTCCVLDEEKQKNDNKVLQSERLEPVRSLLDESQPRTDLEERVFSVVRFPAVATYLHRLRDYKRFVADVEKTYRANKALDEKGEKLLQTVIRDSLFAQIAYDIKDNQSLMRILGLKAETMSSLYGRTNSKYEASREEFTRHRNSLQYNKDGSLRLDDFGQDLNNTRKGRSQHRYEEESFVDQTGQQIRERLAREPLSKIWPEKSIFELYKTNPEAAAALYLYRGEIGERRPAKNAWNYDRYIESASNAISIHRELLTQQLAPEAADSFFDTVYKVKDKYKIWALIEPKYWRFLSSDSIQDGKNFCHQNNYKLTDGSNINAINYALAIDELLPHGDESVFSRQFVDVYGQKRLANRPILADSIDELKKKLNEYLAQVEKHRSNSKQDKKLGRIEFFGRGNQTSCEYEIYGRSGSIELQLTDKMKFENIGAFFYYVKEHSFELTNKYRDLRLEYSKTEKDYRSNSPIRDRKGPDYRNGKDATPEMFTDAFGFRGVEFGNWVKQGKNGRERQWMLNNAYDALYDLSTLLDIPPKAVSLNGTLGLCFGSRGFGNASAHYEPENKIINLTKTKGYSSLAHEWFHALDHFMTKNLYDARTPDSRYLSNLAKPPEYTLSDSCIERIRKSFKKDFEIDDELLVKQFEHSRSSPYEDLLSGKVTEKTWQCQFYGKENGYFATQKSEITLNKNDLVVKPIDHPDVIRPEVFYAWADVMEAIGNSAMHQRMTRKSGYWNKKIEEAARSFEAFVELRCKDLNILNDFLTNDAYRLEPQNKSLFYPYLDGDDVTLVKNKFQALFNQVKSRETDRGVELYSKGTGKTNNTPEEIRKALIKTFGKTVIDGLEKSGFLKIVPSEDELFLSVEKNASLKESAWEIKGFRRRKNNILVPEDSNVEYFALLKIHSKLFPQPIPLILNVGEDKGKGWGFGQKHREGSAKRENSRALPDAPKAKDDADRNFYEIFTTLGGRFDVYDDGQRLTLVGVKKTSIIFDRRFKDGEITHLSYITTIQNAQNLKNFGKHIGSGHIYRPDHEVSATSSQSRVTHATTRQNGIPQSLGPYAPYDNNDSPRKKQDPRIKRSEYSSTQNTYDDVSKRIGSGHIHRPDREDSATPPQSKDNVTSRQNDTPLSLGHYASYDHNNSPRKKQDPRIKRSDDNYIQGAYDEATKTAFLVSANISEKNASAVLLHEVGVHMAYDTVFRSKMQPLIDVAPALIENGIKTGDLVACMAKEKLNLAGVRPKEPHYKEEACAYLVESCALKQAQEPKIVQWFKNVKSTINIWLFEHNFKDASKLTVDDLVVVAKANTRAIAHAIAVDRHSGGGELKFSNASDATRYVVSKLSNLNQDQLKRCADSLNKRFESLNTKEITLKKKELERICNQLSVLFSKFKEQKSTQKSQSDISR